MSNGGCGWASCKYEHFLYRASKFSSNQWCKVLISCDVVIPQEFSNSWGVTATPTFFFLKDGRQIDKLIGSNKLELQRKTAAVSKLLR